MKTTHAVPIFPSESPRASDNLDAIVGLVRERFVGNPWRTNDLRFVRK